MALANFLISKSRFSELGMDNLRLSNGLPQGLSSKESAYNAGDSGDLGSVPGQEDLQEEEMQPTPVFLLGQSHRQSSLVGSRPRGHKESDMTERPSTHSLRPSDAVTAFSPIITSRIAPWVSFEPCKQIACL